MSTSAPDTSSAAPQRIAARHLSWPPPGPPGPIASPSRAAWGPSAAAAARAPSRPAPAPHCRLAAGAPPVRRRASRSRPALTFPEPLRRRLLAGRRRSPPPAAAPPPAPTTPPRTSPPFAGPAPDLRRPAGELAAPRPASPATAPLAGAPRRRPRPDLVNRDQIHRSAQPNAPPASRIPPSRSTSSGFSRG
nr:atherin-like [Aegilops tauschii subsp. strangulata]